MSDDERRAKRLEYKRRYHELHKEQDNAASRKWRSLNKEKVRKAVNEWRKRNPDKLKLHREKSQKKYVDRNRDIVNAHAIVYKAIQSGRIAKDSCEICGAEKAEAHHDDYNYPLRVRWLCKKCHVEWHKNNKPIRKEK